MTFIVAYVPVLHAGYVKFFKKWLPDRLFLIGPDVIVQFPHLRLERDIRVLDCADAYCAIDALHLLDEVSIATPKMLAELVRIMPKTHMVVMPDEDVSRAVAGHYFVGAGICVHFDSVFLRWDKTITEREKEVSPDRIVSFEMLDRELMARAYEEARKSSDWWRRIGALAVRDGEILVCGHNKHMPSVHTPYILGDARSNFDAGESIDLTSAIHAEKFVIDRAARKGIALEGASLYVTTFPCPPCAKDIIEAGIRRLYYTEGYSLFDAEDNLKKFGVEIVRVEQ